jgi:hypothetical protein
MSGVSNSAKRDKSSLHLPCPYHKITGLILYGMKQFMGVC